MADTIREKIIQDRMDVLDEPAKPTGLTVHRYRSRPIQDDELEGAGALVIYPIQDPRGDRTQGANGSAAKRRLRLRCEIRVKGAVPDRRSDKVYSWVVRQMLADTRCGGLARDVEEVGTQWDQELMGSSLGALAVDFDIEYWTNLQDPEKTA